MKKIDRHGKNIIHTLLFRGIIRFRHAGRHFKFFLKWFLAAVIIGIICGLTGTAFHYATDFAARSFNLRPWLLYFLPLGGLIIVFLYRQAGIFNDEGTNSILRAARAEETPAFRIVPLIFISTFITHILGGSAGREGAALQIGGGIGSFLSRKLSFSKAEQQLMVMCGMSATFSALFGTPLTAAFFSIEVAGVGTVFYAGLLPSVLSSLIAYEIASFLGCSNLSFQIAPAQDSGDLKILVAVLLLAVLTAILSIIYCNALHSALRLYRHFFKNQYIRIAAGGILVIILSLIFNTHDYNGIGLPIIAEALSGHASPSAFLLKIILTAVTLGAGFKGGEIIPTLFIGATFGCAIGGLLGLSPVFAAEIALIGLFCGVVNCPISSLFLSVEMFGSSNFVLFGLTAAVSYMLSGYYSLYSGQKFMNSKIIPIPFEKSANK